MSRVKELKNTLTKFSSAVDRICSSSVWEKTSCCWKKSKWNSKWNDYPSFQQKHIFLLDKNILRVKELKKYLNDVVVSGCENLFLIRLGEDYFLLEQKQ